MTSPAVGESWFGVKYCETDTFLVSTAESPIVLFCDSHLCELILWSDVESGGCFCKCWTILHACYQQWQIIFARCVVAVFP